MLSNLRVPRKEELEYMRALQEKRAVEARKLDAKSFDAWMKAQRERITRA